MRLFSRLLAWLLSLFRAPLRTQDPMAASVAEGQYPWFTNVGGDGLEQGDILEACPVYEPPASLSPTAAAAEFDVRTYNLVIVSQSCDLVEGRDALAHVLLCSLCTPAELMPKQGKGKRLEELENLRKGRKPALHLLNRCDLQGMERDFRIVDFRRVFSLPIGFVRNFARDSGQRLRLCPPYREHLAQAFARYFMRVGLPIDIPPFKNS